MKLTEQLLKVGDAYAAATGLSRARVSTIVLNRGATLDRVADGLSDVNTGTFEKAMKWFSAHWPDDAPWPEEVVRPSSQDADRVQPAGPVCAGPALSEAAQ